MANLLYTSYDISEAIRRLFSSPHVRRVAIVAFVGSGVERYLPSPNGIELVCWPQPGSTNPNAIRRLMSLGVDVSFADNLHMKVYWAKGQGAIITSANLSTNALGGRLLEFGVLLPANEFNESQVDQILLSIKKRPVSEEEFRQFEQDHTQVERLRKLKVPGAERIIDPPEDRTPPSFQDWYEQPFPKPWKLATFIPADVPLSKRAKEILQEWRVKEPKWYMSVPNEELKQGDWVLFFERGNILDWFFVDALVKVAPEEPAYQHGAYQIIQIDRNEAAELPFQLSESFRDKVSKAIQQLGDTKWLGSLESADPPKRFIEAIHEQYD